MHLKSNFVYESICFWVFQAHCLRETPIASFMRHAPSWPRREILLLFGCFVLECGLFGGQDPCLPDVWVFPAMECILGSQFIFIDADESNRGREGLLHLLPGFRNCKLVPETISSRDVDFLGAEMIWGVMTRPPKLSSLLLIKLPPNIPQA